MTFSGLVIIRLPDDRQVKASSGNIKFAAKGAGSALMGSLFKATAENRKMTLGNQVASIEDD